jgi:hypothetical protein
LKLQIFGTKIGCIRIIHQLCEDFGSVALSALIAVECVISLAAIPFLISVPRQIWTALPRAWERLLYRYFFYLAFSSVLLRATFQIDYLYYTLDLLYGRFVLLSAVSATLMSNPAFDSERT